MEVGAIVSIITQMSKLELKETYPKSHREQSQDCLTTEPTVLEEVTERK